MSNYLALATVTATIGRLIGEALEAIPDPSGIPRVRYGPPSADPQQVGCTIFLYRVAMNPFRRNEDLATRNAVGEYVERPRAVLDADYLLTFSGDETTLEPQRFLGATVTALHARPFLPADEIRRVVAATTYLSGSDLANGVERVRIAPTSIDHQSLAQLWNTFPQVPYNVSMVYGASAIVLEADVTPLTVGRVQTVNPTVQPR
jgi:hypothetical protein